MSDDVLNRRQRYALLRRKGRSTRKAAEKAGYSGQAPPKARRLASAVETIAGDLPAETQLQREVTRLEFELERARCRLEALRALKCEQAASSA